MGAGIKRSMGGRRHRPMGEINVTPFVDVMLVLLIVFMVTAPLLTVGVEVDLPKTKAGTINADAAPLVVSIKSDGSLYLQETFLEPEVLIPRLKAISNANPDVRIFVRGDEAVNYGKVLSVMGRIQSAGFQKVALVAQLPESQ
ncbi:protein TolR [Candidatus Puniceispirillum sp.]|nr:protein TolR [Candidatus Puniceispirillum sp.]